jgi:hypothetical protein
MLYHQRNARESKILISLIRDLGIPEEFHASAARVAPA